MSLNSLNGCLKRQPWCEADWGVRMQGMLRDQAGLTDLGGSTWRVPNDRSCDSSFHFEPGIAIRFRSSPLLSDYLCGERSTWSEQHVVPSVQHGGRPNAEVVGSSEQHGGGLDCVEKESVEDYETVPSCPECASQSVSWDLDPSAGGVCQDCGYVKRPDTPIEWSDHDSGDSDLETERERKRIAREHWGFLH